MTGKSLRNLFKPILAGAALTMLSGCVYGGHYGDGYVNGAGYACDPYAPFDDYYACDDGYGYANIGFGGGWYDRFYYPGYGIYIFDDRGTRYAMKRHHRRHWARKRAEYGLRHARRGHRPGYHARRDDRRRDLTAEERAERRDRRLQRRDARLRDLSPEERAERRDRRMERRDVRRGSRDGSFDRRTVRRNRAIAPGQGSQPRVNRQRPARRADAGPAPRRPAAAPRARSSVQRAAPRPRPSVRQSPRSPRTDRRNVSDQ